MLLALEIAALVVLLLAIIAIAHYDDGPAGTVARGLLILLAAALAASPFVGAAWWVGWI